MPTELRATVLVVDDDPAIRSLVEAILGEEYAVCVAATGEDAVEAVRRESPDVMLLDVFRRHDQIDEVVQEARAAKPDLAITLFTALSTEEAEAIQARLPGVGLLRKPFDIDDLLEAVSCALANRDGLKAS